MKTNLKHQIIQHTKFFQHHWLWLIVLFFGALTVSANQTAWAVSIQAPHNQTVPTVTPTTEPTPVPTVTPTPGPTTSSTVAESADEAAPLFQSTDLKASVSVIALNMREVDDTGSSIVGTVYLDTEIAVLARNADSTWFYVCCTDENDLPGWVSTQFVTPVFDILRTNELVPLYEEEVAVVPETNQITEEQNTNSEVAEAVPDPNDETEEPPASNGESSNETTENSVAEGTDVADSQAVTVELEPANLQFEMNYTPEFVWQGQEVQIEFIITNISSNPAINVNIRDELLSSFSLLYVTLNEESRAVLETSTSPNGGEIFTITWPELAPQQTERVVVGVQIMADTSNGTAIDNLAAAGADNAPTVTGGMSVGMPPALLPDFR